MDGLERAERITTYADYGGIVEAFFAGHYGLVIVVGRPYIKHGNEDFVIKGSASAYVTYRLCEVLWGEREGRVLLRSLAEMDKPCPVQWEKKRQDGVPNRFATSSPVAIICNSFHFGHASEFAAIVDRGHLFYFDPSPEEVHNFAAWFLNYGKKATGICDYIGEQLDYLPVA